MKIGKKIIRETRKIFSSLLVPIIPPTIAAKAIKGIELSSTDMVVSVFESFDSLYIQIATRKPKVF